MAVSKYGKYIITERKPRSRDPEMDRPDAPGPDMTKVAMSLDDEYLKGAFVEICAWIVKAYPNNVWARAHTHEWDEVINFFGSNMDDIKDLGGEIEFWIEDEKFTLTKSCTIFVPKGMKHCPLIIKRVDRPIFHFICAPAKKYEEHIIKE